MLYHVGRHVAGSISSESLIFYKGMMWARICTLHTDEYLSSVCRRWWNRTTQGHPKATNTPCDFPSAIASTYSATTSPPYRRLFSTTSESPKRDLDPFFREHMSEGLRDPLEDKLVTVFLPDSGTRPLEFFHIASRTLFESSEKRPYSRSPSISWPRLWIWGLYRQEDGSLTSSVSVRR